jgi:hypothetical protein
MARERPTIRCLPTLLAVGALLGGGVAAGIPAQAQGADDFLNDINGIGIGSHDDPRNFDLVGLGNAICWRLYTGEAAGHIADNLVNSSRSDSRPALTPRSGRCRSGFCHSRLVPGRNAKVGRDGGRRWLTCPHEEPRS